MARIEIGSGPISVEKVVDGIKNLRCGCVVTYVGLIRGSSRGKVVVGVEYEDSSGRAADALLQIANEAELRWPVEEVAISHRSAKLSVGDINLVVAVSAAHGREGFTACRYVIDQFKRRLPTKKTETYGDGSALVKDPMQSI